MDAGMGTVVWPTCLFIEAPAGVGFSYADNDEVYDTNDRQAPRHNYRLLLGE
jgi:hypothetical protein